MGTYRIGQPQRSPYSGEWWGQQEGRLYGTFEADTDSAAWERGQELAALPSGWGPDSGLVLALERRESYPCPKLLSGPDVTCHAIQDKHPDGFSVWVRVAVGIHGAPWGEPA